MDNNRSVQSNLGRIQVSFVEFAKGLTSPPYHTSTACRMLVKDIPELQVTVEQEGGGTSNRSAREHRSVTVMTLMPMPK